MLNTKVIDLLNDQVNKELYSAYLYLDFYLYYESVSLDGYAAWYKKQAAEEVEHAEKIMQYLGENNIRTELKEIAKPNVEIKDIKDPLVLSLNHEKYVTSLIHNIYAAASEVNDYRTMQFMHWFIEEQLEEEVNAQANLDHYELYAKTDAGLYELNKAMLKSAK